MILLLNSEFVLLSEQKSVVYFIWITIVKDSIEDISSVGLLKGFHDSGWLLDFVKNYHHSEGIID